MSAPASSAPRRPRILALIPARGGSKGVPDKNIRPVGGRPLICWSIAEALRAGDLFTRVLVSTDSERIAAIARDCGADVPFLRPPDLASDTAKTLPVIQHAVEWVEREDGRPLDWVMLLQPTAPLRTVEDMRTAVAQAETGGCDSVISVVQVFAHHPILMKRIVDNRLEPFCIEEREGTRRQDYDPPAYMRNGCIYLSRRDTLMRDNSIWGAAIRPLVMPEERSANVDSLLDLKVVEALLAERRAP